MKKSRKAKTTWAEMMLTPPADPGPFRPTAQHHLFMELLLADVAKACGLRAFTLMDVQGADEHLKKVHSTRVE